MRSVPTEATPGRQLLPTIDPDRLFRILVIVAAATAGLGFVARMIAVRTSGVVSVVFEQWDPAVQRSVPTWVASMMFLAASLTSALAARMSSESMLRRAWKVYAFAFLALSFDQFVGYHDRLLDGDGLLGLQGVDWVPLAALGAMAVGLGSLPFLARLPGRTRWAVLIAGVIYVIGALGFQELTSITDDAFGHASAAYALATALETFLEMFGAGIYVWASYRYAHGLVGVGRETR